MAGESAAELARRQREKAARLLKSAEHYEAGAAGERRTAAVLDELTAYGYVALHDLRWPGRPRANIDHVLVGPSGVYMIDSKSWSGSVAIGQGTLRQNGYRRDQELASCGEAALALVQKVNTDALPVLCLVRDEELSGLVQNAHVCTTSNIRRLILSRRAILTVEQVRWVVGVLRGTSPEVPTVPQARRSSSVLTAREQAHERRARSRSTAKRASRRSRKGKDLAGLALGLMVALGACSVVQSEKGPGLIGSLLSPGTNSTKAAASFGSTQTITDSGVGVKVRVGEPVDAKPKREGAYVKTGTRLVSVKVVMHNPTTENWQPGTPVRWRGESSLGARLSLWSTPENVTAGRRLPGVEALWPNKRARGVLVFEVPKGQLLESVSIQTSTFGGPDATWSSTGAE